MLQPDDTVYLDGFAVSTARRTLRLSQRQLGAEYAAYRRAHAAVLSGAPLTLHDTAVSHIERSVKGDRYSRVHRHTADALAAVLRVPVAQLLHPDAAAEPAPAPVQPAPPPAQLAELEKGEIRRAGRLLEQEAVELPYISVLARAGFVETGGLTAALTSYETRRVYVRGNPALYMNRVVFEVDGDSMEPYINSGDEVIAVEVPEGKWEATQNCIAVVSYADTVTVKKIIGNDLAVRGTLTLRPYRDELAPTVVNRADIHAIFKVERIRRDFTATL